MLSQAEYDILDRALGSGRYKWPHPYNYFIPEMGDYSSNARATLINQGYMKQRRNKNGLSEGSFMVTEQGKAAYQAECHRRTDAGKLEMLVSMATAKGSLTKEEIIKVVGYENDR